MGKVLIDQGALGLAINVLRTRHNDEVADELVKACTDIEITDTDCESLMFNLGEPITPDDYVIIKEWYNRRFT